MNDNTILKSLRFVCHLNVHSLLLADVKLNFTLAICQTKSLFMMFCFEWPKVVATVRKMFIGLSMVVLVFPKQMAGWKNAPKSGVPKWYPKWLWPWCPGITPLAQQELDVRRHFRSPFKRSRMQQSVEKGSTYIVVKKMKAASKPPKHVLQKSWTVFKRFE